MMRADRLFNKHFNKENIMTKTSTRPSDTYSPLYFLASLGSGGMAVTFFMWLMHWTVYPGHPVPLFYDILATFSAGGTSIRAMIVLAMVGIGVCSFLNLKYMVWNLTHFYRWKQTSAYDQLTSSNAETQILAMPLAMAMTVNVCFILGMVFMPGLWNVVEYLFPLAILVFLAIGVLAFRMLGAFLGRIMVSGGFSCENNNSFSQALPAFALAMVGVGLAAPAGMSATPLVAGIGLVLSTFFLVSSVLIAAIALILGLRSLLQNGANIETAPTLAIFIPILTIISMLSLRQGHGLNEHFGLEGAGIERLMMLSQYLSAQILFFLLTALVLCRLKYFVRFVTGCETSAGSYALVCPGVALVVMIQFWLNRGMVDAGLIVKFSLGYWAITAIALALQLATGWLVFTLNRKHFTKR